LFQQLVGSGRLGQWLVVGRLHLQVTPDANEQSLQQEFIIGIQSILAIRQRTTGPPSHSRVSSITATH
jgi:hypothetical protein